MYSRTIDGLGATWYESLLQTGSSLYQKYQEVKSLQAAKKQAETQQIQLQQLQQMQQEIQAAKAMAPKEPITFGMDTNMMLTIGAVGLIGLMLLRKR